MNDIELLFEDKFCNANISINSKLLFLSKHKISELYDFTNRTKLCELNTKAVIHSVFSEDGKYLALQKASSIDLYDLTDYKKIKTFLIGNSNAFCIITGNFLIYPKTDKLQNSAVVSYNLITQKNEILFSLPYVNISSIKRENENIIILLHKANSDVFTVVKVSLFTSCVAENTYEFPGHGLASVEYSDCMKKLFAVQKNMQQNNSYELYSIDIDSGEKIKIKTFNWKRNSMQLKTGNNKLYISRFFAVTVVDLLTNEENEISVFPAALIGVCDNMDYFYTYNGEYLSLYKH